MQVKQISIFLENKSGRLADVTKVLGDNNIDISALSIADTTDFGILRLIVNKPEDAERILIENGFMVKGTDVVAIAIPDAPGSLSEALKALEQEGLGIEYMYAFVGKTADLALVILRIEDIQKGIEALKKGGIRVLSANEVYKL